MAERALTVAAAQTRPTRTLHSLAMDSFRAMPLPQLQGFLVTLRNTPERENDIVERSCEAVEKEIVHRLRCRTVTESEGER